MDTNGFIHTPRCRALHTGAWAAEYGWLRRNLDEFRARGADAFTFDDDSDSEADVPLLQVKGEFAVVSIHGAMMKARSKFGGTGTVDARKAVREVVSMFRADKIGALLLDIDSPGGTVAGTEALADDVAAASAEMPTFAHISDLGASAALWVSSQAREVSVNNTGEVGSIGVFAVLEDSSEMAKDSGLTVHLITTGPFKGAGVDGVEITDEQVAAVQTGVDSVNDIFKASIVRGRPFLADNIDDLADGNVHLAEHALALGLVDVIRSDVATGERVAAVARETMAANERRRQGQRNSARLAVERERARA